MLLRCLIRSHMPFITGSWSPIRRPCAMQIESEAAAPRRVLNYSPSVETYPITPPATRARRCGRKRTRSEAPTAMAFTVRTFRDQDEPAVARLWCAVFQSSPPRNEPLAVIARKRRVQPELFLVGEADGAVVGTVLAGYDGHRGWVYHVAVAPGVRRRGYGRAMMVAAEERLRALGCPKLNLQINRSNAEVVAFYESLGYAVEDRVSMGKAFT